MLSELECPPLSTFERSSAQSEFDGIFSGCIPALITPCGLDRKLIFEALVGKGQQLMQAGVNGMVDRGSLALVQRLRNLQATESQS